MKQLLFLLLFPCLAIAQYQGNGNQKITLGEQTTADGLVYRGLAADTTRKPSVDTMAYILLDTNTNIIWQYKKATNNAWTRVGGSISSGVTGVLPVANGGTGSATQNFVDLTTTQSVGGAKTFSSNLLVIGGKALFGYSTSIGRLNQKLEITTSNDYGGTATTTFSSTPIYAGLIDFQKSANNTLGNHTIVSNNEALGYFTFRGSDGFVFRDAASIRSFIDGSTSSSSMPGRLTFLTTPSESITSTERMRITSSGNVGIGQTTPTAVLHLKAGTATASTAPLKFTSGTNLTTAEAGAMEFNGTNLFFSPSTTRHTVNHGLTGSATLDFPSTTTLLSADLTITVAGAANGDVVSLGVPNAAVNANTCYTAWVSVANTVTVRFNNYSSGTVDPASGLFKVFVTK